MPAGRPTVMTDEVIRKLEDAFLSDATNEEACVYADICETAFYKYKAANPKFTENIERLKGMTGLKAKVVIRESIENGDKHDAKWWLERRDKDFKPKKETDVNIGAHKSLIDAIIESKKGKT
jgi:hypothetical protein